MSQEEGTRSPLVLSQADARALMNLKQLLRHTRSICWITIAISMLLFTRMELPVRLWFALSAIGCLATVVFDAITGIDYLRGCRSLHNGIEATKKFLWISGFYLAVSQHFKPDPIRWWFVGVNIAWYVASSVIFLVIVAPVGNYIYKAAEE